MSNKLYHASLEGAQHGPKGLFNFLDFANSSGADGAQPSCSMLEKPGGGFMSAHIIQDAFESRSMKLDGISAHCPFYVQTTAWTGSKAIRPFLTEAEKNDPTSIIEKKKEDYLLNLMDLSAELGVKIMPMFWGLAFGWELATGYPWGFWQGGDYDLIAEGKQRFVNKTSKLRKHANERGIKLCHEIHPGTAAMCADDFNMLVKICDEDECLGVNADPSHCWEGETWEQRFLKVAPRIYAAHLKNFVIRPGFALRTMEPNWQKRAMQFTDLPSGELNMSRYVEALVLAGYPQRYREIMKRKTAPLVVEAESAYRDLDKTSRNGVEYVRDNLCFELADGSFEKGMGTAK